MEKVILAFLSFMAEHPGLQNFLLNLNRYLMPILAFWLLYRCAKPLLTFRKQPEIWAWLNVGEKVSIPVTHWENVIGRSKGCDIVINIPTVSRSHAVLTRYEDGSWTVSDIGSRGGVIVGGKKVAMRAIRFGDIFSLGGIDFSLQPVSGEEKKAQAQYRTKPGADMAPSATLFLLTVFQLAAMLELMLNMGAEHAFHIMEGFLSIAILQWLMYFIFRLMHRTGYEVETIAFYLCSIGIGIIASASPSGIRKEILALILGMVLFFALGFSLRSLETAKKIRYLAAAAGILLMLVNLVFGSEKFGARNWISLGGMSFQPSELVKVCFIFVGASTMDRIVARRNLILFIGYSAMICGCLVLISDFGTALIFFAAFLVIAFLRSGDFAGIALICTGTGFAATIAVKFRPYILNRFAAWGHVWDYANVSGGYQQTRSMMCIASGGLFGLGKGTGFMKYVAASDTDLVFALISEEWGLLIAVMTVLFLVLLGIFVVRSVRVARSTFYTIGACAAVCIMLVQTVLNVFGTVDFLPLTGVTFPFVSNGGSSMLASWAMLAFIKAADTRQNASFAIRLPSRREETRDE